MVKQLKDKRFAAKVERAEVHAGAELLGVELPSTSHSSSTRCARTPSELGLQGSPARSPRPGGQTRGLRAEVEPSRSTMVGYRPPMVFQQLAASLWATSASDPTWLVPRGPCPAPGSVRDR